MDLIDTILSRRSIRQFDKTKPVKTTDIQTILTAAMYAPSAMNKRPWMFVIVDDKKVQKQLMEAHPYADFMMDAGTAIVVCEDTSKTYAEYGAIDTAMASQNILLAAHTMGYGACYCGLFPNAERMNDFAKILKCPPEIRPMGLIILGTPLKQPPRPSRFEASKIVHNRF